MQVRKDLRGGRIEAFPLLVLRERVSTGPALRPCAACGNVTYQNPLPVAVGLVPVDDGLLLVRRTVAPRIGCLALPGGFINMGETWQQGCVREIEEETGLRVPAEEVQLFDVMSAAEGMVLIFGIMAPRCAADLPAFVANPETSEVVLMREPGELAFPLHTLAAGQFWKERPLNSPDNSCVIG